MTSTIVRPATAFFSPAGFDSKSSIFQTGPTRSRSWVFFPLKQVLSVALAAARVSHRLALAGYHIRPTQLVDNPFGRNRGFAMIQDSVFRHLGNINRDWTGHPGSVQFTGRLTRSLRIL